jgi:hypothetical protein
VPVAPRATPDWPGGGTLGHCLCIHEQNARRAVADDAEGVRRAPRHRHPVSGTNEAVVVDTLAEASLSDQW